jgi:molecular chaperone DnaK
LKKQLEELKDKFTGDQKSRLETEIKKLEDAIASNNSDQMKSATDSLNKVWSEMASQLYQQPGAGSPQQPGDASQSGPSDPSGKPEDKNVQDASYEVVDDEKDKDKKK